MKQNNVYDSPNLEILEIELEVQFATSIASGSLYMNDDSIEKYEEGDSYTW